MAPFDPAGKLDHLVYAVLDLDEAAAMIEDATGVRPVEGGRHLGRGTRNYLLGLSPTSYLEIIALDHDNPVTEGNPVAFHLDRVDADRMLTWAIHPVDIDGALVKSRRHGADHGKLTPMWRIDNDGNELHWTLAVCEDLPHDGLAPFFIDWGDSVHPAASGIPAAELTELRATYPAPDRISALYKDLRLGVEVTDGAAALHATIEGPRGAITL